MPDISSDRPVRTGNVSPRMPMRINDNVTPRLEGQETDNSEPAPDMEPPADDLYDIDREESDTDDSGAPPFTGEDLEDVGDRERRDRRDLPTM